MTGVLQRLNPYQIVLASYAILIAAGTFLLMMPFAVSGRAPLDFADALFMASSAVCVSGVSLFDLGTEFSVFGQMVVIVLVQVGALGIMTITTLMAVLMGKRIQLRGRLMIQESLQRWSVAGVVRLVLTIAKMTFMFEFIGGVLLTVIFYDEYGEMGIYYGFWHSVSAFCNAGFDILGGSKFAGYELMMLFDMIIWFEVVCGGLGFAVLLDIYQKRCWSKLNINSKIVLAATFILIAMGSIFVLAIEYNNPSTLGSISSPVQKAVLSVFTASMVRTSGFCAFDMNGFAEPTIMVFILLMFIGGSPASTGGGIKTTTIAVIFAAVWSLIRGRSDVVIFKRTVPPMAIFRALTIFFVSAAVVMLTSLLLSLMNNIAMGKALFEAVSMFSTVGLPTGTVGDMDMASRMLSIVVMLMGRIGIISFAMALVVRKKKDKLRYPEDKFIIG